MRRYLITYANDAFAGAMRRVLAEARATGEFDEVIGYGPSDASEAVRVGPLFRERRGGGYWTWKPDIICRTLERCEEGDIVVYVDSGCQIVPGREWRRFWRILDEKQLIVQRIYQVMGRWTRQTIVQAFPENPHGWLNQCQFLSGAIMMRKTEYVCRFMDEWRTLMIERPDMVRDVLPEERHLERRDFIENRHDQAVLSALLYRDLSDLEKRGRICARWEHVENLSLFRSQVIRAFRICDDRNASVTRKCRESVIRIVKDVVRKPWYAIVHG